MSNESSTLQCIESVKNRSRTPSTKNIEASLVSPSHFNLRQQRRQQASKNKPYDIEIVEEDWSRVKVHYCGYSSEFDEWKLKSEVMYAKPTFKPSEQQFSPLTELACAIKKWLLPRRSDDPEVRIHVLCDLPSFWVLQGLGKPRKGGAMTDTDCKQQYTINDFHDLDDFLGKKMASKGSEHSWRFLLCYTWKTLFLSQGHPILDYDVNKLEMGVMGL